MREQKSEKQMKQTWIEFLFVHMKGGKYEHVPHKKSAIPLLVCFVFYSALRRFKFKTAQTQRGNAKIFLATAHRFIWSMVPAWCYLSVKPIIWLSNVSLCYAIVTFSFEFSNASKRPIDCAIV